MCKLPSIMSANIGYSTPLLHVAEIEKSIAFYVELGFTTIDTDRCDPLGWARLHCEGGAVMFLRAEAQIDASAQALVLCMYTPDLAGLREQLLGNGVTVPAIDCPDYLPSGKFNITDPDGYHIEVVHWGKPEQEAWEKRIGQAG
jgi:catechol 2,3-dioxygenase-like lactoylglutathione lyase family enzyme